MKQMSLFPKPRPVQPRVVDERPPEIRVFDFLADGDLSRLVPQPDFVPPEELRIAVLDDHFTGDTNGKL